MFYDIKKNECTFKSMLQSCHSLKAEIWTISDWTSNCFIGFTDAAVKIPHRKQNASKPELT